MTRLDNDDVIAELQSRVAERRRRGQYPQGLEEQLDGEFAALMHAIHRTEIDTGRLGQLVTEVASAAARPFGKPPTSSRFPGGVALHRATTKFIQRDLNLVQESVTSLGSAIADALSETRRLFDAQRAADERQLLDVIAGLTDRLAVLDSLLETSRDLEERVFALERVVAGQP